MVHGAFLFWCWFYTSMIWLSRGMDGWMDVIWDDECAGGTSSSTWTKAMLKWDLSHRVKAQKTNSTHVAT